jgi:hypothetical protein
VRKLENRETPEDYRKYSGVSIFYTLIPTLVVEVT